MPSDKGFKKLVRRRMRTTSERYTVARARLASRPATVPPLPPPNVSPGGMPMDVIQGPRGPMYPFQRFTEDAKKALTLAQREAEGSRHGYIGTEHLLLGILADEVGLGGIALRNLGVELESVRATIVSVIGRNERIVVDKIVPTSRVKSVIEISFQEAKRMGSDHVGTEHFLLGLMIEGDGIARHVLDDLGANLGMIRKEIYRLLAERGPATRPGSPESEAPTADTADISALHRVLNAASAIAHAHGAKLGPEHMLLALARETDTPAGRLLAEVGLTEAEMERRLAAAPPPKKPGKRPASGAQAGQRPKAQAGPGPKAPAEAQAKRKRGAPPP